MSAKTDVMILAGDELRFKNHLIWYALSATLCFGKKSGNDKNICQIQ